MKNLILEDIINEYEHIFNGTVGKLEGKITIKIKEGAQPIKHTQRTVPVPLRERVKEKLGELEKNNIIQKMSEPMDWISSMVVRVKKYGDIRICLDSKELNQEILKENYTLPVIEEIATSLTFFSIFEVKNGFWHVELDKESSMMTTFNTPFGRYRWKRLPFGICSVPELFQRKMHELIEGLEGVEVIADDFLII